MGATALRLETSQEILKRIGREGHSMVIALGLHTNSRIPSHQSTNLLRFSPFFPPGTQADDDDNERDRNWGFT